MTASSHASCDEASDEAPDEYWMRVALAVGKQAEGRVGANPPVGCVILDKYGILAGIGHTGAGGRPHAETEALVMAGAGAAGGTAYITLEPCAHTGQTPPCADALIAAGIKKCVIGILDPDKRVNGAGVAKLRAAGIAVIEECLSAEAEAAMAGFLSRQHHARPYITMKIAISADGYIAGGAGQRTQITGDMARRWTHDLRSRHDAILTGIGTAQVDDPLLTCRAPSLASDSPIRIVLDTELRLSLDSQLVKTLKQIPLLIVIGPDVSDKQKAPFSKAGAEFITIPVVAGALSLPDLFHKLAERGINTVLVEAGARLNSSLLSPPALADQIYVLQGPEKLGEGGLKAVVGAQWLETLLKTNYMLKWSDMLGKDSITCWQAPKRV